MAILDISEGHRVMRAIHVGGVWPSGRRRGHLQRALSVLLVSCLGLVPQAWGQGTPTAPSHLSVTSSKVDVPRQLTLEAAEQLLMQYNLAVIAARYGVDSARAQRLIAAVRPNPTLTLGAEQFDLAAPGRALVSNSNSAANRTYTARIDQIFERGNKRALRTAAAEFQVQDAEAQVLDTLRTQVLQLRQAFYTALLSRDNVQVARENLALTQETERLIKARVTAGDAPEWDRLNFQTNKVQVELVLVTARLRYRQAVRDVLTCVGVARPASNPPLEVVGELRGEPPPVAFSLAELQQAALDTRPDVLAAQRSVEAAR